MRALANPNANSEDASTSARDALVMKHRRHINYGAAAEDSMLTDIMLTFDYIENNASFPNLELTNVGRGFRN